jgi:heterotetrameric sarcosine oxidase gamma subunit
MLEPVTLTQRSAFAGLLQPVNASDTAGVLASERTDLQIATVVARQGREALAERVRSTYGIDLPVGPKRAATDRIAFIGTGPRTWLALRQDGGSLVDDLQHALGDIAAVSDQSDGYAVLRLSGDKVRATFEKGLSVDLHPRAFRPGDAAVTTCSHLGVIIWQLDEAPSYEIALFRSLAAAFWHWLAESAAEFGLKVTPSDRG